MASTHPDENEIYFLIAETDGAGQFTNTFFNGQTWTSLYKYTYLCGDGSDTCGIWEDLSASIPANRPTTFDNFNAQGGYDLLVKVKPDNPDIVFIGGTNLWRSTDGFQSDSNTAQIGGISKAPITDKETGIFTTPTTPINTTCYFYLRSKCYD